MTETMPEPGIYPAIPFSVYQSWPAVHQSRLWTLATRTPAHYREEVEHPEEVDTDAMALGRAVHFAVLEPELFPTLYVQEPAPPDGCEKWDRRTKLHREAWAAWQDTIGTREPLDASNWDFCQRARDAARSHPVAAALLKRASPEVAMVWVDRATGLTIKARPDGLIAPAGIILDLKTCLNAEAPTFGRAAGLYGYHFQLALYWEVVD